MAESIPELSGTVAEIVERVLDKLSQNKPVTSPKFGPSAVNLVGQVPIGVSNRHLHVSREDLDILYGSGHDLGVRNPLYQPGQFAAKETVTIVGPKMRAIENVRILGPLRDNTQVEVSQTDSYYLGVEPPVRQSGKLEGSTPITIVGPRGTLHNREGLIIAHRHIHINEEDANKMGLVDNQVVRVRAGKAKGVLFEDVIIRVSPKFKSELHLDLDEANAAGVTTGMLASIIP